MVMWLRLSTVLIFLLLLQQSAAATSFTARLSAEKIEQGKTVHLILTSQQASPSLNTIKLDSLENDFFIDRNNDISTTADRQQWQLRLYPRRRGRLTIPPLVYAQSRSQPLTVTVTRAIDAKTGHQLQIASSVSTHQPWLNQQVLLSFSIISQDKHIVLHTTAPETGSGKLYALPLQANSYKQDSQSLVQHTTGWSYFPTQAGKQLLELPPVRYQRDGIDTHIFYLPRQTLQVQPLPLYVPRNLPVGDFSLQVNVSTTPMLSGRLHYLDLTLNGRGMQKTQLPQLQQHLQSQAGLSIYPADIHGEQATTPEGLISQAHIQVPFKAQATGIRHFNDIKLSYFDAQDGKIKMLVYHWPTLYFINPWLLVILGIVTALIGLYGFKKLLALARYYLHRYRIRRQARQCLHAATHPQQIKQAIMLLSSLDGEANTTLQRWQQNKSVDIEPLSKALYQAENSDIQQLKQYYLSLCR